MKAFTIFLVLFTSSIAGCGVVRDVFPRPGYSFAQANESAAYGMYEQAAERLIRCASNPKNPDQSLCAKRIDELKANGTSIAQALRDNRNRIDRRARARSGDNPWDKYFLFSELSADVTQPLDSGEIDRVAREAFEGFGECAKQTDPSCMGMYGELILRGSNTLDASSNAEARRRALYWLNLAARYGYEPARRALVVEGENIPTPDLAMELLQKESNAIARDSIQSQELAERARAARDYEMIREVRRQTEQLKWNNLFPAMVSCTSNTVRSYTYTTCR